jgi:hypothetical protein
LLHRAFGRIGSILYRLACSVLNAFHSTLCGFGGLLCGSLDRLLRLPGDLRRPLRGVCSTFRHLTDRVRRLSYCVGRSLGGLSYRVGGPLCDLAYLLGGLSYGVTRVLDGFACALADLTNGLTRAFSYLADCLSCTFAYLAHCLARALANFL